MSWFLRNTPRRNTPRGGTRAIVSSDSEQPSAYAELLTSPSSAHTAGARQRGDSVFPQRPSTAVALPGLLGATAAAVLLAGCATSAPPTASSPTTTSVQAPPSSVAPVSSETTPTPPIDAPTDPGAVATDAPVPAPTGSTAPVVLTYADWDATSASIEIGAFVQGVVETGGQCSATASRNGVAAVTDVVQGEPDADSTSCPGLSLAGAELEPGVWSVVVTYASADVRGESQTSTVVVP